MGYRNFLHALVFEGLGFPGRAHILVQTLLAAFVGEEAFHPDEQDEIDMLSKLYLPDLDKLAERRLRGGILTRMRRPKRRKKRRAKKIPE